MCCYGRHFFDDYAGLCESEREVLRCSPKQIERTPIFVEIDVGRYYRCLVIGRNGSNIVLSQGIDEFG
jgi:hypothetical protein